ncbi:MAG: hypothetical protein H0X38_14010 [Planctomycetes bacterium]|nr:hypothetical protein [Planctomycetota bacterium]
MRRRNILIWVALATVCVGAYVVAYVSWRNAHGQTFEDYQSYEPGMLSEEHAGEWIMGVMSSESLLGRFYAPLIWVDEKWFKLVVVAE